MIYCEKVYDTSNDDIMKCRQETQKDISTSAVQWTVEQLLSSFYYLILSPLSIPLHHVFTVSVCVLVVTGPAARVRFILVISLCILSLL
jgi:hypothetical protein